MGSFHGTNGRECPARATLSLVLDRSDCSVVSPVDGVVTFSAHVRALMLVRMVQSQVAISIILVGQHTLVLGMGKVSQVVDPEVEGNLSTLVSCVVLDDLLHVGDEGQELGVVLGFSAVTLEIDRTNVRSQKTR